MVEGDGCHRVAREHRKTLVGRKFVASSPNRRFKAGAAAIARAGGVLIKIEVHGKNLFYFFGKKGAGPTLVVHIHFGMAGAFAVYQGEEPETTANTRLRLQSQDAGKPIVAHLSAMTVEHGSLESLYRPLAAKLGPDPLREDGKPETLIEVCGRLKKPIGGVLMDQSCIAGVGNIYRSETLYEAGIHPEQPASSLSRQEVSRLWSIIVKQMQDGFRTGSIWGRKKGPACYGLKKSACGGKVREWQMGGRNVFACSKRQSFDASRSTAPGSANPRAGTAHIKNMTPAAAAEARKRRSGEGLGVQHVALKDDATRRGALASKGKKSIVHRRPSAASDGPSAKRTRMA